MTRRQRGPTDIIRFVIRILQRTKGYKADPWPISAPGGRASDAIVVADGLGTCSLRLHNREPWVSTLGGVLDPFRNRYQIIAFSYYLPGFHYEPANTADAIVEAERLFNPYAPAEDGVGRRVYLGFSIGGDLFALGLSAWLRRQQPSRAPHGVIMVEPPIQVGEQFVAAAQTMDTLPGSLAQLLVNEEGVKADLLAAIAEITRRSIPLVVLYWADDPFTVYTPDVVLDLTAAGARCVPVPCAIDVGKNPFSQHADVAGDAAMLKAVGAELSTMC